MPRPERKRKFTTTAPSEVTNLVWKVENFNKLAELEAGQLLDYITLEFEAGETIQMPSKWRLGFDTDDLDKNELGVFLQILLSPDECRQVYVNFDLVVKYADGIEYKRQRLLSDGKNPQMPQDIKSFLCKRLYLQDTFTSLSEFLRINAQKEDESIILELRLELFNLNNIGEATNTENNYDGKSKLARFEEKSSQAILRNYHQLLIQGENSDFKIVTKDGKEFPVHRSVIAAQSPVFKSMLLTKMTEASSGTVLIEDLTSEAMDVLLKFMYSGRLSEDWIDVIDQVVYAAEKYELTLLKDFCDEILIEAVTIENSSDMLKLARKFSLKTAEKDLMDYISKNLKEFLNKTVLL